MSLISAQKQIDLSNLENFTPSYLKYDSGVPIYFINLPFNKIFMTVSVNGFNRSMLVINENGLILYSAYLNDNSEKELFDVSSFHIIRLLVGRNQVFIYNLHLELCHNFGRESLKDQDYTRISVNYDEYSFFGCPNTKICVYNYKKMDHTYINLQSENPSQPFYVYSNVNDVLHINKDKLYILNYIPYGDEHIHMTYMIDRQTGKMLANRINIFDKKDDSCPIITFDHNSNMYLYYTHTQKCLYSIYNSSLEFMFNLDGIANGFLFNYPYLKFFSNTEYDKSNNLIKFVEHNTIYS